MYKTLADILSEPLHESFLVPGYKTGYPSLDHGLGGILNSDLVLLPARPGIYGNNLLHNLAMGFSRHYPLLFISTTKNARAVAWELKSVLLRNDQFAEYDEETMNDLDRLAANIFIEAGTRFLADIDRVIGMFRLENKGEAVVMIDNLNGIFLSKEIRTGPKEQEERDVAVNLEMLTLKYNLPVIILAKVKSTDPIHPGDPPALCDAEHLTGLNCPFDKIIGVNQPDNNGVETDENGKPIENKLLLRVLKNNNGMCGIIRLNISLSNRFRLTDEIQSRFE
jgi:hypothetical protein